MKTRFVVLPLILAMALFLGSGCMDKGDPAWGEKQENLLEELLNKPNIKYGELVIDHKKKQWVIPNLEITTGVSGSLRSVCTVESVTGVNVALEPVEVENSLLAGTLEIRGLVCQEVRDQEGSAEPGNEQTGDAESVGEAVTAADAFTLNSLIIENLKGGKELHEAILNIGDKASLEMLKTASMDRLALNGVNLVVDTVNVFSLKSFSLENMADGFVGPVALDTLVLSPESYTMKSLSVGFMGAKKIGSQKLLDELVKLQGEPALEDFSKLFMGIDFLVEDMEYKDVSFAFFDDAVPPITIKKVTGYSSFDGQKGKTVSKLEGLTIATETLQHIGPDSLRNYAFKPVNLSMETEVEIDSVEGAYTLDYKKIHFADPVYGAFDARLSLTGGKELFQISPYGAQMQDTKINSFVFSFDDKSLTDTIFEVLSMRSGNGLDGAQSLRMVSSAGLRLQCGQLPDNLKGACNDTATFLEKKGFIEYSFAPEQPLGLDNLLKSLDTLEIKTKVVPAGQ